MPVLRLSKVRAPAVMAGRGRPPGGGPCFQPPLMRIDPSEHLRGPWRVRALAPDFLLLDVWEYPIRTKDADGLAGFIEIGRGQEGSLAQGGGLTARLFRFRRWLGKRLGWDHPVERSIPGCAEKSLRERLPEDERATLAGESNLGFRPVYSKRTENLREISNATVHALIHLAWVDKRDGTFAPQLAVYAKPRGLLGRVYLALIAPFRHFVVYPALMRHMRAAWEQAERQGRTR